MEGKIPKRPFVVSVRQVGVFREDHSIMAHWMDKRKVQAHSQWYKVDARGKTYADGSLVIRIYFAGNWALTQIEGSQVAPVHRVVSYRVPYPADHIVLSLRNVIIDEIELRSLRPEEFPLELRQVEQTVKTLQPLPDFPETTIPPAK